MSKKITFTCELCGDARDIDDLRGIHFTGNGVSDMAFKHPNDCNRHLCVWCIDAIIGAQGLFDTKGRY